MREIILNGYIDEEVWFGDEITPDHLHALLYAADKDQTEDVHIRLNSYGGSCNAAVRMHDDLAAYPGKVTITVSGTAASAATVLCMAADHLEMTPGSLWMIHDPSVLAIGNARDLKDAIRLLETCKESILNVYASRIRIPREQAANMMTKTTWMDAHQALEDGFVDGIQEQAHTTMVDDPVNRAAAEHQVQIWLDRMKLHSTVRNKHAYKEDVLREVQPRAVPDTQKEETPLAEETPEPCAAAAPPVSSQSPPAPGLTENGTPISQLRKRLALIMPKEAEKKEKMYE